jgi:beta-aspartyl-peptidase (threonine type)
MAAARGEVALEETPLTPRIVHRLAAALTAVVLACGVTRAAETPDAAATAVRAVLAAQVEAWNRGDLEGYMGGYWKSPDLVFFSNGQETRGWQATLDRYRARYQGAGKQMGKLDFPAMDVVTLGPDAALARGRWRLKMPDGKELTGMTTVVLRKRPEGWRIVHDHSSADVG